jgi:hypothetical protein
MLPLHLTLAFARLVPLNHFVSKMTLLLLSAWELVLMKLLVRCVMMGITFRMDTVLFVLYSNSAPLMIPTLLVLDLRTLVLLAILLII